MLALSAFLLFAAPSPQVEILETPDTVERQQTTAPAKLRVKLDKPNRFGGDAGPKARAIGWSTRELRHVSVGDLTVEALVVEIDLGRKGGAFRVTAATRMAPGRDQDVTIKVTIADGEQPIASAVSDWSAHDEGKAEQRKFSGRHNRPADFWHDLAARGTAHLVVEVDIRPER